MNLIARIAEAPGRSRPRNSPKARELALDTIIEGDCIAAMARLLLRRLDLWPEYDGASLDVAEYPAAEQRCDDVARATLWQPPRTWAPRPLPTVERPTETASSARTRSRFIVPS